MVCPKCGSKNVHEVDNLHCIWLCGDCGHQDDGAEFDEELNSCTEAVYFDTLPDQSDEGWSDIDTTPVTITVHCNKCGKTETVNVIREDLDAAYIYQGDGVYSQLLCECECQ